MELPIRAETRTGDTPAGKAQTPARKPAAGADDNTGSLELMLTWDDAAEFFGGLECIILDELHALAGNKRGDLLSLSLARLRRLAPGARSIGLSATVASPENLRSWLDPDPANVEIIRRHRQLNLKYQSSPVTPICPGPGIPLPGLSKISTG